MRYLRLARRVYWAIVHPERHWEDVVSECYLVEDEEGLHISGNVNRWCVRRTRDARLKALGITDDEFLELESTKQFISVWVKG